MAAGLVLAQLQGTGFRLCCPSLGGSPWHVGPRASGRGSTSVSCFVAALIRAGSGYNTGYIRTSGGNSSSDRKRVRPDSPPPHPGPRRCPVAPLHFAALSVAQRTTNLSTARPLRDLPLKQNHMPCGLLFLACCSAHTVFSRSVQRVSGQRFLSWLKCSFFFSFLFLFLSLLA